MSFLFFVHISAFLFSCFVIGALLGAGFSKPLRTRLTALVPFKPPLPMIPEEHPVAPKTELPKNVTLLE